MAKDAETQDATEEALAFRKILELGMRQIEAGKTVTVEEAMRRVRQRARTTLDIPPAP